MRCAGAHALPLVTKRFFAVCTADGFDLNKTTVEAGSATAYAKYSDDYIGVEAHTKAARLGIWSSAFDQPEEWRLAQALARAPSGDRAKRQSSAAPTAFTGYVIKGNRNRTASGSVTRQVCLMTMRPAPKRCAARPPRALEVIAGRSRGDPQSPNHG